MTKINNINIPKGATYRITIISSYVGMIHVFTYNESFTDGSNAPEQWQPENEVWMLADDNVITRQPVKMLTFDEYQAQSTAMKSLLKSVRSLNGWLVTPEWNRFTSQNLVIGIYRKFLTIPLTINKTFTAITSDAV